MNVKDHYEKFWQEKKVDFYNYSRNLVLKDFFKPGEKVLDLGCGDGVVSGYLQDQCKADVTGIDISEMAVKAARKRGVHALVGDTEKKLPFDSKSFDVVFWGDNIEHLFDPFQTATEIKRVLRSGGRVVLSTPNTAYWRYRLYYFVNGQLPDTEWTGFPRWGWSHIRFFNATILNQLLVAAGFKKITRVVGVSSRRLDKPLLKFSPSLFGMILVVEAEV